MPGGGRRIPAILPPRPPGPGGSGGRGAGNPPAGGVSYHGSPPPGGSEGGRRPLHGNAAEPAAPGAAAGGRVPGALAAKRHAPRGHRIPPAVRGATCSRLAGGGAAAPGPPGGAESRWGRGGKPVPVERLHRPRQPQPPGEPALGGAGRGGPGLSHSSDCPSGLGDRRPGSGRLPALSGRLGFLVRSAAPGGAVCLAGHPPGGVGPRTNPAPAGSAGGHGKSAARFGPFVRRSEFAAFGGDPVPESPEAVSGIGQEELLCG